MSYLVVNKYFGVFLMDIIGKKLIAVGNFCTIQTGLQAVGCVNIFTKKSEINKAVK